MLNNSDIFDGATIDKDSILVYSELPPDERAFPAKQRAAQLDEMKRDYDEAEALLDGNEEEEENLLLAKGSISPFSLPDSNALAPLMLTEIHSGNAQGDATRNPRVNTKSGKQETMQSNTSEIHFEFSPSSVASISGNERITILDGGILEESEVKRRTVPLSGVDEIVSMKSSERIHWLFGISVMLFFLVLPALKGQNKVNPPPDPSGASEYQSALKGRSKDDPPPDPSGTSEYQSALKGQNKIDPPPDLPDPPSVRPLSTFAKEDFIEGHKELKVREAVENSSHQEAAKRTEAVAYLAGGKGQSINFGSAANVTIRDIVVNNVQAQPQIEPHHQNVRKGVLNKEIEEFGKPQQPQSQGAMKMPARKLPQQQPHSENKGLCRQLAEEAAQRVKERDARIEEEKIASKEAEGEGQDEINTKMHEKQYKMLTAGVPDDAILHSLMSEKMTEKEAKDIIKKLKTMREEEVEDKNSKLSAGNENKIAAKRAEVAE